MFQDKDKGKLYTAIVFFADQKPPHKYRNVKFPEFMNYAEKLGAYYVNFYDKMKIYQFREYTRNHKK